MATMVGTQQDLAKLLNELIELDLDAAAAYRVAVEKLQNPSDKAQLSLFLSDHERHVLELRPLVANLGERPADSTDLKAVLTKGKVYIGSIFGDRAILTAMRTNEDDTNTAYERACNRSDLPTPVRTVLLRNWADEQRHREYIVQRLSRHEESTVTR